MADSRVKEQALQMIGLCEALPRLVVFDLDYTLWPFYWSRVFAVDFRKPRNKRTSEVQRNQFSKAKKQEDFRGTTKSISKAKKQEDFKGTTKSIFKSQETRGLQSECRSKREMPSLYPHAKGILYALKDKGIDVAIASRSPTPDIAKAFLDKLGIQTMFVAQEIFSSWCYKREHFQRIHRRTGVPYKSMLFFDDEDRNIDVVSQMGVTSILVEDGVNLEKFRMGLENFVSNTSENAE